MLEELLDSPHLIAAIILFLIGIFLVYKGIKALFNAQVGSFVLQLLSGSLLLALGALLGVISIGMQGYHALTYEESAAKITINPVSNQNFIATFKFPDSSSVSYTILGDEIYVDANILKWKPLANIIGLHTGYELDRVGGRYRDIEQEKNSERSLYPLRQKKKVNLFDLRLKYTFLSILMDAKYGSATYIPVTQPVTLDLKVTTTGLILRELPSSVK